MTTLSTIRKSVSISVTPAVGGFTPVGSTDGLPGYQPMPLAGFYPTQQYLDVRMYTDESGKRVARPAEYLEYRLAYDLLRFTLPRSSEEIAALVKANLHGHFDPSLPYVFVSTLFNTFNPAVPLPTVLPSPAVVTTAVRNAWDSGAVSETSFIGAGRFTFRTDARSVAVVGIARPGIDPSDPSAIEFGFLFRSTGRVAILESGVESVLSPATYVSAATTFGVQYVNGVVDYTVDGVSLRRVVTVPPAAPTAYRAAVSLFSAYASVTAVALEQLTYGRAVLPKLRVVTRRPTARITLPKLQAGGGWKPYAAVRLPRLKVFGGAGAYSRSEVRLPGLVAFGGYHARPALPKLIVSGSQVPNGRAVLPRMAVFGSAGSASSGKAALPGLTARGLTGRVVPRGGAAVLPRLRSVATGKVVPQGAAAVVLPSLQGRGARNIATAGSGGRTSLPALNVFAFQDPTGEAYLSAAPLAARTLDATRLIAVSIDSSGAIVTVGLVQAVLDGQVSGGMQLAPTLTPAAVLHALMTTELVGASYQPMSEQGGETWVINADTGASSSYENYAFNSFATIGGRLYGVRSDGLYLMEGDTDDGAPIRSALSFGTSNFGTQMLKRLEYAMVGVASSGTTYLKIKLQGDVEYTYAARRSDDYMAMQRIDVGRGTRASYITFEMYNGDGCDFELDTVSFHAAELTRRI